MNESCHIPDIGSSTQANNPSGVSIDWNCFMNESCKFPVIGPNVQANDPHRVTKQDVVLYL